MDKEVAERGQDCFWNGNVEQFFAKGNREYVATVAIREDYSVTLKLDQRGEIVWEECDCACKQGPRCKHVLAVFFAVRDGQVI